MSQADRARAAGAPVFSLFGDLREALGYMQNRVWQRSRVRMQHTNEDSGARVQLTNDDMRAKQQEGSDSVKSAAAHTRQAPDCKKFCRGDQHRAEHGSILSRNTSATSTVVASHQNIARELLRNGADNIKSTPPPLAIPRRPTLRINDQL